MAKILPPSDIDLICETLKSGEPCALPTETVYGLAAPALNAEAVNKIFALKGRPNYDPLIVHISDLSQLQEVTAPLGPLQETTDLLIKRFWPGPLTLVLPKSTKVPGVVTSSLDTVGVRMPAFELMRKVIREVGPLAAPSANLFGGISPTQALHVEKELGTKVRYILDGGACSVGLESTVIRVEEKSVTLLRPGGVSVESLEAVVSVNLNPTQEIRSPGQLDRHYSPRKNLLLLNHPIEHEDSQKRIQSLGVQHIGLLTPIKREWSLGPQRVYTAHSLYNDLRILDEDPNVEYLVAEPTQTVDLGRALMDRLKRASQS